MTMPTSISLSDAAATPVAHVFTPIQNGAESKWVNATGATTIAGQETLAVEVQRAKTDAAQHKARVVLWDPFEVTVDSQTKVAHGNSIAVNITFAPGSTLQDKKDILKMMANALTNADIVSAVTNVTPFI